jgi:hypothetical protein
MSASEEMKMGGLTVKEYCQAYRRSKSATYADIRAGRLKAHKVATKTILLKANILEWERALPALDSSTATAQRTKKRKGR